jgi:hypothetical protein
LTVELDLTSTLLLIGLLPALYTGAWLVAGAIQTIVVAQSMTVTIRVVGWVTFPAAAAVLCGIWGAVRAIIA